MGKLTVLKREITVQSSSAEKVYDSLPFGELTASVTQGELVNGERIEYRFEKQGETLVGSYQNGFDFGITDASGREVSGNYIVTKQTGELKITPRPVTVTGSDRTWIYDGTVHSATTLLPRFTVSDTGVGFGLVEGHTLDCNTYATIHRVGETENTPPIP